jgi:ribonuclease BN (tRNA processing enzyme)
MKVTVLGSGGAFAPVAQGNSAFLVEIGHRKILIDCGTTVPYVLRDEMGIPLQEITDIVVTHCHGDHIGGLEHLLYSCYFLGKKHKPRLFAENSVLNDLRTALGPGMRWLQGSAMPVDPISEFTTINTTNIGLNTVIPIVDVELQFIKTEHVSAMPSTGVRLGPLFISGDTRFPVIQDHLAQTAELIFHEAHLGTAYPGLVHAPVSEIVEAAEKFDLSKVWLYHCPIRLPEDIEPFAGVLMKGQTFEL